MPQIVTDEFRPNKERAAIMAVPETVCETLQDSRVVIWAHLDALDTSAESTVRSRVDS